MALDHPFLVQIDVKSGGSFGETMNAIRTWLDHRHIQAAATFRQPRLTRLRTLEAVLGLRLASTARMRRTFSKRLSMPEPCPND